MRQIPLLPLDAGYVALIDDGDFEMLSRYRWHAVPTSSGGKKAQASINDKTVLMHRLIMNAPRGTQVDHKNLNPLDNQRSNLRLCTNAQNACNQRSHRNTTSRFRGVHWHKRNKKWVAVISKNGDDLYLGSFQSEAEAAKAYDREALFLHGEFACLNFPLEAKDAAA